MVERNQRLEQDPIFGDIEKFEDGPWKELPHFFRFEYKGYRCYASKGPLFTWCGYVILPKKHKLYEKGYDDIKVRAKGILGLFKKRKYIDVHGGLTYADYEDKENKEGWTIGFDCAHSGDKVPRPKCLEDFYKEHDKKFGKWFLDETYKDKNYVEQEIKNLVDQLL